MITSDRRWFDMIDQDLSRTTVDSFLMSISSLHRTNLVSDLKNLQMPVMGIYGKKDILVNPMQWKLLQENVSNVHIERFESAGHFPMLDQPDKFKKTLLAFLNGS